MLLDARQIAVIRSLGVAGEKIAREVHSFKILLCSEFADPEQINSGAGILCVCIEQLEKRVRIQCKLQRTRPYVPYRRQRRQNRRCTWHEREKRNCGTLFEKGPSECGIHKGVSRIRDHNLRTGRLALQLRFAPSHPSLKWNKLGCFKSRLRRSPLVCTAIQLPSSL